MKRLAPRLLIAFTLLLGTLLLALGWLLATESGLQFLWRQVAAQAGPEFTVTRVSGRLAGHLAVAELRYTTAAFSLSVEQLEIDWEPRGLLSGTLAISKIRAAAVHYAQLAATPDSGPARTELPAVVLPLALHLDALRVDSLTIVSAPDSEALRLQDVALSASACGTRVTLSSLSLAAPGLTLRGTAGMELRDDYPLQGTLDWQWRDATLAPVDARTRLAGNLRRLELVQQIQPPYSVQAELTLIDVLDALQLDGTLTLQDSALAGIDSSLPPLQIDAALTLTGPLEQLRIRGSISSVDAQAQRVDAVLDAELRAALLAVHSLQLSLPERTAALQLRGELDFAVAGTGLDLQADWRDLAWPPYSEPDLTSASGTLALEGSFEDYRFSGAASLDAPEFTSTRVQLQGHGNLDALELTALDARLLDGSLQGSARLAWSPQLASRFELSGSKLNPGMRWPDWSGELAVRLRGSLETDGEAAWQLRLDEAGASGRLHGQPVQLAMRASVRPGAVQIDSGELTSGPSRLTLQGSLGESLDLAWKVDSPDLATLAPDAAGRLSGNGRLQGNPQAPRLTAQLDGQDLRYRSDRVGKLQLAASVDIAGAQASQLDLVVNDGRLAGNRIDTFELKGSGYPQSHALTLTAAGSGHTARLTVDGSWRQDVWNYTLTQATFTPAGLSTWNLRQAVSGQVSAAQARLPQTCWSDTASSLCLQGSATAAGYAAEFRLQDLPLATLATLLPGEIQLKGQLNGNGRFQQDNAAAATAQVRLTTTTGELGVVSDSGETDTLLAFAPGSLSLDLDADQARIEVALPLQGNAGSLAGQASVRATRQDWAAGDLTGEVLARLPDIAFAGHLLPDVSNLQGRLDGQFTLAGTPAAPRLQGRLLLSGGRVLLDTPGLLLEDVRIDLSGQPDGDVRVDASARSGDGVLVMRGVANLAGSQPRAQLRIEGDEVRAVNTLEAEIDVSPRLDVALSGKRIDVNGELRVPHADIHPRQLPGSAVTASSDQVIVEDGQPQAAADDYPVYANVRFTLGDDVRFEGLGLRGQLGGSVVAVDEPGRPTRASGELSIRDGRYRAYGQDLKIRRGRLLFAGGPLIEPGLDIEAVREPAPDILVGVKVRGNLQQPVVTTFSEPGMTQSEQLSWLVLGRPLQDNTSNSEQSALNNAALMLGLTGGETLGKELGNRIGVDEVEVTSDAGDTTSASLLVGKYLSPKLFVSYGVGLFEPVSTLQLRYTLSSKWKLLGEASDLRSSADIFYVIESGD